MIVPNLRVAEMSRSLGFYRDLLGLELVLAVTSGREMTDDAGRSDIVFAILRWNDAELMLQTAASLAEELPSLQGPGGGGAAIIYFRGLHPATVESRLSAAAIVKGPVRQWYGMLELYAEDPDGHVLCFAVPEGPPPDQG